MATGHERFLKMTAAAPTVLPSLLQCDFGNLEREVERLEEAGVAGLHLDVMDGVFVPNFTYGITICLLYTSPSPRDLSTSRMPSSA